MAPPRRRKALTKMAESVAIWSHSIDLGAGVVTAGTLSATELGRRWASIEVGGLAGRTVLDVGSGDGYFAFRAEEEKATRVVAMEYEAWCTDPSGRAAYTRDCRQRGVVPRPPDAVPEAWDPQGLPGKAGFDVAHRARESRVEPVVADFMTVDLEWLGPFDVVLFLDELNRARYPFLAIERLAALTRGVAVIEVEGVAVPGFEHHAFSEFFALDELNGDPANWWSPNLKALGSMCTAAGFRRVVVGDPARARPPTRDQLHRFRTVVTAWK